MKPDETQNNPDNPVVVEVDLAEIERARNHMARKMLRQAHNWRQDGTWIKCSSCAFPHGFAVTPGHFLQGIDSDGKPILKKLW